MRPPLLFPLYGFSPVWGGNGPAPTCSLPRRSPAGPIHLLVRVGGRGGAPLPTASLAPSLRASGWAPGPTRPRAAAGEGVVGRGGPERGRGRPPPRAGGRGRAPRAGWGGGAAERGAAAMAGGARLLWVSLLVLLALLRPQPGLGRPRERLRVRFTPAVCGLSCVHGPTGPRCTPTCAPRNATSVDSGAPGGAAPGGPGFRACECGVVVPREGFPGWRRIPGDGGDSPQGAGAQIPCAVVLGNPWLI